MSEEIIKGPVLITGANTGIGRKTLELLTSKGIEVYACARKEKDLKELDGLTNTTAIKLDVTKKEEIKQAVQQVKELGKGLYGLVNNAGIANVGQIFTHSEEAMYEMFDINVFGIHRVTTAMLPFLFESKGRIVNISSISGILTASFFGLYSMGKHAVEAYSDALYVNLKDAGIEVSIIEPGNFKSEIGMSMYTKRLDEKKDLRILMTDEQREMQLKEMKENFASPEPYPEPDDVAEAIFDALNSEMPKSRYLVTSNQEETNWVIKRMLFEMCQMNSNHKYSYSREEIIEILDQVMHEKEFEF